MQMWAKNLTQILGVATLLLGGSLTACLDSRPSELASETPLVPMTPTLLIVASPTTISTIALADPYKTQRQIMVEQQLKGRDISDTTVLAAMGQVPRHEFVPTDYHSEAYNDHPLPIGYGQTISQPYIVALMSQLIDLQPGDRVLEIGTGSGYQAAILAALTDKVYTIEIIPELAERAQNTFDQLGYDQIKAKQADGYGGWQRPAHLRPLL